MPVKITPGHTTTVHGVFTSSNILVEAGAPGGVLITKGHDSSSGTLTIGATSVTGDTGGTLVTQGVFSNYGIIDISGGLASGGLLLDTGLLVNATGATLGVGASAPNQQTNPGYGGVLEITGSLVNKGTLDLFGAAPKQIFQQQNYYVVAGGTALVVGSLSNAGLLNVGIHTPAQIGYVSDALLSVSGQLTNAGTLYVLGGNPGLFGSPPANTLAISGTLTNQGLVKLGVGDQVLYNAAASAGGVLSTTGVFLNNGTLLVSGLFGNVPYASSGATASVGGVLENTGLVEVQQSATLSVGGSLDNASQLTLAGGTEYNNYGTISNVTRAILTVGGTLYNSGSVSLGGGFVDNGIYGAAGGLGASAAINGVMVNTGQFEVGGGVGSFTSGRLNPQQEDGRHPYTVFGYGGILQINGTVTDAGTLTARAGVKASFHGSGTGTGGTIEVLGTLLLSAVPAQGATTPMVFLAGTGSAEGALTVADQGVLTLDGGTVGGTGFLLNLGTIDGNSGSIAAGTFQNDKAVYATQGAALSILSAVTSDLGQQGTLLIGASATLTLAGAVQAGQSVLFNAGSLGNGASTLALGNLPAFGGTLDGLAVNDVIDALNTDIVSAVAVGTTLALGLAAGGSIDLTLGAPASGIGFSLGSDGAGGTDITVTSANLHPGT